MSRYRTNLTDDIVGVKNRVQRIFEDGNIKLGSVVSDVFGVAGLNVLRLLAEGTTHADVLASSVTTNIKRRGEVKKSLINCFTMNLSLGSANKAKVALDYRIARAIYKIIAGDRYKDLGYMRSDPKEHKIKLLIKQLKNLGVDVHHHNHQLFTSVRKVNVDNTGITLN